jgi:hypothetical protein
MKESFLGNEQTEARAAAAVDDGTGWQMPAG